MSEPFLAEVRMVGFSFAPRGWAFCDGQILPISQNQSLFSLLGTMYGGDGRTSFALPDLRGRTPIHADDENRLGRRGGEEVHTLTVVELPAHGHTARGVDADATSGDPSGRFPAKTATRPYRPCGNNVAMNAAIVASSGGSQAHQNMQPYLAVSFVIALQGLFPSRN